MQKTEYAAWKRLLFSETLVSKNTNHKIAYIAMTTALVVIVNMFFEFKLAETQFSLTLAVSALAGIVIGPLFGFVACFLGDLVGFLYNSYGYAYLPWIGISLGLTAAIAGLIVGGIKTSSRGGLYGKLGLVSVLTFAVCTVGVNTTAFWLLYAPQLNFWTYFVSRIFVQGQIFNSLFNYAVLFIATPALERLKILNGKIKPTK